MIYSDLLLNTKVFNNLLSFYKSKKYPNAFIFYGDNGIGKEAHAIEFIAFLNCNSKKDNTACGECSSCHKVKKLQHENLEIIMPYPKTKPISKNDHPLKALNSKEIESLEEKLIQKGKDPYFKLKFKNANTILINSIREIKKNISLSLPNNSIKVFLIINSEKLCSPNDASGNSLLKILEEPPKNNLFILITTDLSLLLDTIISRCITIPFQTLTDEQIKDFLTTNKNIKEDKAKLISKISLGNINKSIYLLNNLDAHINLIEKFILYIFNDNNSLYHNLIFSTNNKDDTKEILEFLNIFFRDLLVFKKTGDINKIKFLSFKENIISIISKYKHTNWEDCIQLINNALQNLDKNVNVLLIITALFLEIKKILDLKYYNINQSIEWLNYPN